MLLLLLSLPAWAQVERNSSNLTSRQRTDGGSHRGGWISPSGTDEEPVWTYRQELAVRRVFRSITADVAGLLAAYSKPDSETQTITARLVKPEIKQLQQRTVMHEDADVEVQEALAAAATEPSTDAVPEDPAEAAVDSPEDSAVVDQPSLPPAPELDTEEITADAAPDPPAEADTEPAGRDFRIRRNPDRSRQGIGELRFPEEREVSTPPLTDAVEEGVQRALQDSAESAEAAIADGSPADAGLSAGAGFIPDRDSPAPAILQTTAGRLAIPGSRTAPLLPGPAGELPARKAYQIRDDLHRITRGNGKLRQVALTFDDGPHPEYTGQILAILDFYNAPATFFFVGVQANKHPQWLQMAHQQGHEIGSQTYDHFRLPKLPPGEKEYQIDAYQDLVEQLTGERPRFLRPPGGQIDDASQKLLNERRMVCAMWDVALNDTHGNKTREELLQHTLDSVQNGSVILAHDGVQATIDMLPELIERLREEGYELVTMSELASTL